ncbi:MAG: hypothetical protein AUI10_05120 [Actinobacteria bacterium 13_2_20CM_2_72_6]|nr:MAG: hypothetical protein AUI10_05120 [Actinobacteria bacterium 13_2_20CM_2_72_6]
MVRWLVAALAGVLGTLVMASPASAHAADAPPASDYRCVVTGISPALAGLTIRAVNAGTQLELVNRTGRTIEVLGYSGEPYLRIAPDGVYQNANSPATYLNQGVSGGPAPPVTASPAAPPSWQKLSGTPAVLWHDHRAHWMATTRPPSVDADPGSPHRISSWSVPLRDGVREFAVTGTLDWVPPPAPAAWWAGGLLLAAAVAGLGLLRSPRVLPIAAGVAAVAGLAALGYAIAGAVDTGPLGARGALRALVATQPWPLLCGVATVAAAAYAARRRPAADLALGLTGACLALYAGAGNAAIFAHAVPPVWLAGGAARLLVLLCVGGGAGLAGLVALRMRRPAARPPVSQDLGRLHPVEGG